MRLAWLRQRPACGAGIYLAVATLWIVASDKLVVLLVDDPLLIAKISMAKGVAFVVITTVLLYVFNLPQVAEMDGVCATIPKSTARTRQLCLFGSFVGLAALVPLVGYSIVIHQEPRFEQKAVDDLRAISDLKVDQIQSWLDEWRADASALMVDAGFVDSLDRWLAARDHHARKTVLGVLQSLEKAHHYDMMVVGVDGRPVLAEDSRPDMAVPGRQALVAASLRSGRIVSSDLYKESAGRIRLDFIVPLLRKEGQGRRAVGAVVLCPPVEKFLFPLIRRWPTPSPTGEAFLVRREGSDVVYLNELRFREGIALSFRLPIASNPKLPAALGALSEEPRTVKEGIDYRGADVLAVVRPIEGTSWRLVAKLDREEVLVPLKDLIWWVVILALVAVAAVGIVVAMLWRQQQRANHLELAARTAEKDKLLRLFYDMPFIGMAMTSPTSRRFVYANDCLCRMLGYTPRATINILLYGGAGAYASHGVINAHQVFCTRRAPMAGYLLLPDYMPCH